MVDPTTVTEAEFTVVGRHYEGTNEAGGIAALWSDLDDEASALESVRQGPEWYGVSYGGDPDTGEFEYVAGVRATPDAEVPGAFTAVDVPAATYVRFETTLSRIEATMHEVHTAWLPASEYDLAMGPEFERYPAEFDRSDPEATFEIYVPVVPAEE